MAAKLHRNGQVLATMKTEKLTSALSNNKKRSSKIKKELVKRNVTLKA